ncbi:prolyl oligopeptidase family serine peptidase [Bythopirellula polymerisocia]|uniref:prolyl oligopeptidase n=1 Tax=Bythopirellula polymerisocia TaxID=2528003 RepID=A0A5C6CM79_9BACT|nr:prolyl oligopeptidase family serine peptidase [Bythopirellula polymerisocia]TWU24667.1 Prolyl endopeptidase precursor [Bythopirellula polymerisocia]
MECLRNAVIVAMVASSWVVVDISNAKESRLVYPDARRGDQVDTFHGVDVPDPYRWMEEDVRTSEEVADWVAAENIITRKYLDGIPERGAIEERLTKLWNFERFSVPTKTAGKYFFLKNDGLQNQAVLYVADTDDGAGRVLIDPNQWSEDGTISLGFMAESDDAKHLAYGRKDAGSDWSTIYVMDISTGEQLPDKLEWTRWGGIQWNAVGTGFFYTRYPEPKAEEQHQALAINPAIYFHQLGDSQSEDTLVYKRPDEPTWSFEIRRSDDNQFLVLMISRSTDPQNQVFFRRVNDSLDAPFRPLVEDFENQFWFLGNVDEQLYFLTDLEAPTKRVVALDVDSLEGGKSIREQMTEIVPATEATLEGVTLFEDQIVAKYLKDVVSQVMAFELDGTPMHAIGLPGIGSADGFSGRQSDSVTFFSFTSYVAPASIFRLDLETGKSTLIRQPEVEFDRSLFESRQAFYTSKDGTRVPIIVSHRKGLEHNGQLPTLLYGYGGFDISLSPYFSVAYATWMEMGGVVAVPNLRGGGEYGEAWHQAGKKLKKQNVFDDFIAAADWLISEKYTSMPKLAIMGGSNGGLLVGAALTQRPDLFGACLPAVGVLDMLRYQNFTAGHFWRDEYGTVDDPDEFRALLAYSPYHNVRPGTEYPATMILTADTDDRVVPMHSFKFGAALQSAQAGPAPILMRIETRAGHGAGTPTTKKIEETADCWAFLWKNLGMSAGE